MRPIVLWPLLAFTWIAALFVAGIACSRLGSRHLYGEHTHVQVALALALCIVVATWIVLELVSVGFRCKQRSCTNYATADDPEAEPIGARMDTAKTHQVGNAEADRAASQVAVRKTSNAAPEKPFFHVMLAPMRAGAEVAVILAFAYLCDRTAVFSEGHKRRDRIMFWGVWMVLCVAACFTVKKLKIATPISREQTEEWKGWMQLMFVMYHYFEAKEVYNAIRVYIAAYVWMTGYGNFSLYLKGKSFAIRRSLQMMFRLNFMGFLICVALNNEYLLYYICAMHTFFTVLVILALYIKQDFNKSRIAIYVKLALTIGLTVLLYDGPTVIFRAVFGMLPVVHPLFSFHDPLHPEFKDEMHEWHFRSGLDRFIWIIGMVFALHYADFEAAIGWLNGMSAARRNVSQAIIVAIALLVGTVWWWYVFSLDKYSYNAMHPFTSSVPIAVYLLLRNCTATLRQHYLGLFAYLGRVTLETYIFQFHIWMRTTGLNGSPKRILVIVPGSIPGQFWINLAIWSGIYLFLSVRFSAVTMTLRDALIPEGSRAIAARWAGVVVFAAISWVAASLFTGAEPLIKMV